LCTSERQEDVVSPIDFSSILLAERFASNVNSEFKLVMYDTVESMILQAEDVVAQCTFNL
jgi:hypothetical protein